ncbi:hypothetical protein BaRGS_00017016 [Batillaria attramentaria]|uniref:Neuronal acetylcholine receptor subunit alpha-10-like n=1 Tax=Batillaria attramentaria TaxID=370345 RepID=A0ABD0KXJ4_9CAEN
MAERDVSQDERMIKTFPGQVTRTLNDRNTRRVEEVSMASKECPAARGQSERSCLEVQEGDVSRLVLASTQCPVPLIRYVTLGNPCHSSFALDGNHIHTLLTEFSDVEDYTEGYMQALAMVSHDGNVFWPPIVKFHSTCQIDITFFPFDDQVCTMKLGSWAYDGFQVDVVNRSSGVDLSNYVTNGEWHLLKVTAERNVVYYPCCPEPFPDVKFRLYLRRRTLYYTYNVIIPCVMLSTLTLLVFWMSPESGEKVTLGLTVLLAFSVFMLLIAENMPATSSYVPLIGIYLTSVMGLTSLSVILAVVVSNISVRGRKDKVMPRFLRTCIMFLARMMCFKLHYVTAGVSSGRVLSQGQRSRSGVLYKGVQNHLSADSGCGLIDHDVAFDFQGTSRGVGGLPEQSSSAAALRAEFRRSRREERMRGDGSADMEDILLRLRDVLAREEEKDSGENLCREWQEAAEVIDRFLFAIFVVGTLAATITSLVILPLTKKPLDGAE